MKGARAWVLRRRCLGGDGVGYVEDIIARTDAACLIDIHLKRISYQERSTAAASVCKDPGSSQMPS